MDALTPLVSSLGLGLLAGARLYATVFAVGMLLRFEWITLPASWQHVAVLSDTRVLVLSCIACVIEFISSRFSAVFFVSRARCGRSRQERACKTARAGRRFPELEVSQIQRFGHGNKAHSEMLQFLGSGTVAVITATEGQGSGIAWASGSGSNQRMRSTVL
jgi:Domain of unknown function (DUF4126)